MNNKELRVCESCGYSRGFHISFKTAKDITEVILICPNCGSSYMLDLSENRIKSIKYTEGKKFTEFEKNEDK